MLSTNTFKVESTIHSSLGHTLQLSTECQIKEEPLEVISDAELEQLYTEDIVTEVQEEQCGLKDDNYQRSHLEDPIYIIKEEVDDVETGCFLRSEDLKRRRQSTEKTSIESSLGKLIRNKEAEADFEEPRSIGARVSKKLKIAALKDTEDATTNKRKIEEIKNEQTETVTIIEPKIATKKIEIEKSISASNILETCDKADINLIKCDVDVNKSVVNDVCEQKYTNDTFLEQNVNSISSRENKPFSCDTCNKCFSYKHHLKTHIRTHTGEKPYQCNVCNKCFSYKHYLKTHIRTHTGEKPYQCNVCNKCFSYKPHLKTHIRTHTGEKPYQCNVCKKCFSIKYNLKTHIRTHTGEKPYQCNVCMKCFNQKTNFKTHILKHTGEKPYQCNVCKKCFGSQSILKDHILTHTFDKPYQCKVCKKCFSRKYDLKTHIRTHTGEKPYQCNVCKKCFRDSSHYSKHIRIHKR